MMTDHTFELVKPWGIFLDEITRKVKDEEFSRLKLLLIDKLTAREREKVQHPRELLELLDEKGLIGEDNTALLGEIFDTAELYEFRVILDNYVHLRKVYVDRVSILAWRRDPLFVGRDMYIREIVDFFRETRHLGVRCVCLWGMAGTGKTKLGAETCGVYAEMKAPPPSVVLVDLNKKSTVEDLGVTWLDAVGKPVEAALYNPSMVWNWMRMCITEHVLLFDNADDLLKPTSLTKDHFQNVLKQALECRNDNVKIIITSRYAVSFPFLLRHPNFKQMEVRSLEMEEAVKLLTMSVQQGAREAAPQVKGRDLITTEQAVQLAEFCGNNPQALRAVASQLQLKKKPEVILRRLANPTKMAEVLSGPSIWGLGQDATEESAQGSRQVLECLSVMFEDMTPRLQPLLVRLAIFPGLFSSKRGISILLDSLQDDDDIDAEELSVMREDLEYMLCDIAATSLLLRESLDIFQKRGEWSEEGEGEREEEFYSMHPLVRCLCLIKVEKDDKLRQAFQAGMLSFVKGCYHLLKEFTAFDIQDSSGSLQRIEKERINITQYLELEMRRTFEGKPHPLARYLPDYGRMVEHSNIGRNSDIQAFMERFMFTKERSLFFQQRGQVAWEAGDLEGWVSYQGWYADQQLQLHRFSNAEEAIKDPIMHCEKQMTMTRDLREGYCQCMYVKGNLLVKKPQPSSHMQNSSRREGEKLLEKCIHLRKQNLKASIVTARSINALGSTFFECKEYEKALEKHSEAFAMLEQVTNGHPERHPDSTFYVMNKGTCFHELGWKLSSTMTQKEKGRQYFEKAIQMYNLGQTFLRGVGLERSSIMGTMLKNLAMTYTEMKDYGTALNYADEAAGIRVRTLGEDHPAVARAHYFTGSIYMSMGKEKRKAGKNVFEIEEFKKARECFDHALEIEFKVGYNRRSQDYGDLKEDIEKLFKILGKTHEWQRYSEKFKRHEKGAFVQVSELTSERGAGPSQGSSGQGSPTRKRTGDPGLLTSDNPDSPPGEKKCDVS